MGSLGTVSDDTFADLVLRAPGTIVVDFWAEWCPPCRLLEPVLEELAAEHPASLTILKLDADENPTTALAYRAMSLPTLTVFRHGQVVKTITGARPKAALERDLAGLF
jgi:thioredoxin 1